jgi:hypothetical protein
MSLFHIQAKHRDKDGHYLCPACGHIVAEAEAKCVSCGSSILWDHKDDPLPAVEKAGAGQSAEPANTNKPADAAGGS